MNAFRQASLVEADTEAPAGGGLPWQVRLLVRLSTSQWAPDPQVRPEVTKLVELLSTQGWLVRGAHPRNYLLWRFGSTLTATRHRIVVLPLRFGRLSSAEVNVLLATELFVARRRAVAGSIVLTEPETDVLDRLCQRMVAHSGMVLLDRERVYRKAKREIERTIAQV